jgi:hypothetical protein
VRVLLVSRDAMLAEALESLVEAPGEVRLLDWRVDSLEPALPHADVVVVDVPPSLQERTFAGIDGRFLGRTVVLLQEGEPEEAVPPVPARVVLYRPWSWSSPARSGWARPAGAARGPDLLVPDLRVGSDGAVHALAVGAWLRLTRSDAAPLGQLAVRVGLIPEGARRLERVPGLPGRAVPAAVDPGPLLGRLAAGVGLLALAGAAGVAARAGSARRVRSGPPPGD